MFAKTKQYFQEVGLELKKVTWPSRDEVRGSTMVVIVAVILITVFIGLVDQILSRILRLIVG